jgi:hypothetical protein
MMSLDSTNSGVQVMSIIAKDPISAATCNIVNTGRREDLYGKILDALKGVTLSRDEIKEVIIPMLYGSVKEPMRVFKGEELEAFTHAVESTIPALGDCREVFSSCWDPNATSHSWVLPDGHVAYVPVLDVFEMKVDSSELCHRFTYQVKEQCTSENYTSLLANIVHSIDAYVVREMVRRLHKMGVQIGIIHDSFWFSPIYGNQIRQTYLDIMVELAKSNLANDIVFQLTGEKDSLSFDHEDMWVEVERAEYALS